MRIQRFIQILACCCLTSAVLAIQADAAKASQGWMKQRTGSLAWLHSLFFLDQNRGWAAGSRGALLVTTDGGITWKQSQPTRDTIRDVYFIDDLNGFLVCERNVYELKSNAEPRAYLMKTTNGGQEWQRLTPGALDGRLTRAIFNNTGHGWALGEGGALYITNDAGSNWKRLQTPTRYLLLGGTFLDQNSGWLVGAGSTILQTLDGGVTWNHGRIPNPNVRFNSASFVNSRLGWAVGNGGAIYRTANGGISWQMQTSGVTADILDVKFLNAREGWAVGAEGTLLHTIDGGYRWLPERSGTSHSLERIFFIDSNHGWAVGFGGTVIAYGSTNSPKLQR